MNLKREEEQNLVADGEPSKKSNNAVSKLGKFALNGIKKMVKDTVSIPVDTAKAAKNLADNAKRQDNLLATEANESPTFGK
jgi:hypothetical protein